MTFVRLTSVFDRVQESGRKNLGSYKSDNNLLETIKIIM